MYVLDTNTLIYFFKGLANVPDRLLATPPRGIGVPTVVVYELLVGLRKSTSPEKRAEQLESLLAWANVLPFGLPEAGAAARIRVNLERQGQPIGPYEILTAATALANRAVLVSRNVEEFGRVPGLTVEDWYS